MKKKTKKIRVPSDAIFYILGALGSYARFTISKPEISAAFYQISKKEEFKKLFKDVAFSKDYHPWNSETINIALNRLGLSVLLNTINLELYEVTPYLAAKDPAEVFSKKEIELIKKAAAEFEKLISGGVERIKTCKCRTCECQTPSLKIGMTD